MFCLFKQCGFFRRGTKEELEKLLNRDRHDQNEDAISVYAEIAENNTNNGIVQLNLSQGAAGYTPVPQHSGKIFLYSQFEPFWLLKETSLPPSSLYH